VAQLIGELEPLDQTVPKLLVVRLSAMALEPFMQSFHGICEWVMSSSTARAL
jgi:hypothetical protein